MTNVPSSGRKIVKYTVSNAEATLNSNICIMLKKKKKKRNKKNLKLTDVKNVFINLKSKKKNVSLMSGNKTYLVTTW